MGEQDSKGQNTVELFTRKRKVHNTTTLMSWRDLVRAAERTVVVRRPRIFSRSISVGWYSCQLYARSPNSAFRSQNLALVPRSKTLHSCDRSALRIRVPVSEHL